MSARAPRRTLWPVGVALAALVMVTVPMTVGLATSGVIAAAFEPGPLAGEARFTVTLAAMLESIGE